MSVMPISTEHLLAMIDFVVVAQIKNQNMLRRVYLNGRKYDPAYSDADRFTLFRELYLCNDSAYRDRYEDIPPLAWQDKEGIIRAIYKPRKSTLDLLCKKFPWQPIDIIKLCHCLQYNGDEKHPGYKIAQDIIELATEELPGYDNAPWTI